MSDLKQQSNIVKQNLYYHFADSCGNWIIPDDMKFLNEVLNDIMKLCNLANSASDEPQIDTCNMHGVSGSALNAAKQIQQVPQTQMALNDQLKILRIAANKLGLYDAADFIKRD